MIFLWVLTLLLLAVAWVALVRFQRAETLWSRILNGVTAMVTGVPGLVLLFALFAGIV